MQLFQIRQLEDNKLLDYVYADTTQQAMDYYKRHTKGFGAEEFSVVRDSDEEEKHLKQTGKHTPAYMQSLAAMQEQQVIGYFNIKEEVAVRDSKNEQECGVLTENTAKQKQHALEVWYGKNRIK